MPMTMTLPDPKTGRKVTFDWPGETPPSTEELEKYVFGPARKMAAEKGLIPNLPGLTEGPLATTKPQGLPTTPAQRTEYEQALKKAAGAGLELGLPIALMPITGGGSLLSRLAVGGAIDALAGAGAGAITGEGAANEALDNAALGMVGEAGGDLIPLGATMVAQALGGQVPKLKNALPFIREGKRQWSEASSLKDALKPRIGVGNEKATKAQMGKVGDMVRQAEEANPARIPVETELKPIQELRDKSFPSEFPLDVDKTVEDRLFKRMEQHAKKKGTWVKGPDWGGTPPIPGKRPTPAASHAQGQVLDVEPVPSHGQLQASNETALSTTRRRPLPSKRRVHEAKVVGEVGPSASRKITPIEGAKVEDVTPDFFPGRDPVPGGWDIHPATDYSMRETGDLKRAAGSRSSDIIKKRQNKDYISPDESLLQQIDAGTEKAWREAQYAADAPKVHEPVSDNILLPNFGAKKIGPIQKANQRMSDLHKMDEVNSLLKDPTILGRVGQFTTRAALGGGAGYALADLTDGSRSGFGVAGSVAGMLGLNPRAMSAIGNVTGRAAQAAPTSWRLIDFLENEEIVRKDKNKTKRRDPK